MPVFLTLTSRSKAEVATAVTALNKIWSIYRQANKSKSNIHVGYGNKKSYR